MDRKYMAIVSKEEANVLKVRERLGDLSPNHNEKKLSTNSLEMALQFAEVAFQNEKMGE